jgi:hypothetical protein
VKLRFAVLLEFVPGFTLLVPALLLVYMRSAALSALPLLAVLLLFLSASLITKRVLCKTLSRFYSWRLCDTISPLLLLPPQLLLLQTGYEFYNLWSEQTLARLMTSLLCGLALFLIAYPILKRL